MRDISGAKVAEKEIKKLSFYDQLTNLPNRRLLLDRLRLTAGTHTRRSERRALLFVDPDDFKTLNDTLGHHSGDLVLQEIALRLTTCLRVDDTVARLSGDEFVVLLEDLSENLEEALTQAKAVAEKVLAIVDLPYQIDGRECRMTSCIGITVFGNNLESASEALQQADLAMHQAKAAGRDSIHFFVPALQIAVNARALMEEELRLAMSGNQFLLYYQPQVDRGCLIGAEALLRWNHPKRGIVSPDEFIPLAEETGLILPELCTRPFGNP
jgi:diguanylate cyclase (GGDEF)-like protein